MSTIEELLAAVREHMKMKYTGDCKCGRCQLVPLDLLDKVAFALDASLQAKALLLSNQNRVSDDRLESMLGAISGPAVGALVLTDQKDISDIRHALQELKTLRTLSTTEHVSSDTFENPDKSNMGREG